jgi:hypothetical protein
LEQAVDRQDTFWEEFWGFVAAAFIVIGIVGLLVWWAISFVNNKEAKEASRIESTTFESSGVIESTRESKVVKSSKGLIVDMYDVVEERYISVNGNEYRLHDGLDNMELATGQSVIIKGYDEKVREISILK